MAPLVAASDAAETFTRRRHRLLEPGSTRRSKPHRAARAPRIRRAGANAFSEQPTLSTLARYRRSISARIYDTQLLRFSESVSTVIGTTLRSKECVGFAINSAFRFSERVSNVIGRRSDFRSEWLM